MLERLKTFVRGVIRKMFSAKSIEQALDVKPCISSVMQERIEFWHNLYIGMAPWCKGSVTSLRKEQGICMEFANVCLNEMESQVSIERLDDIYKRAIQDLNENLQSGLALGSFIIKPLGGDKVEYLTADKFVPLAYDERGRLTDVVFVQDKKDGEDYYRRLERHTLIDSMLTISNRAFVSKSQDDIGREISLESVEEWKNFPKSISYQGIDKPDFGYYRNPIKNEIDGSPCGVSIYEAGIDRLEEVDIQNARIKWEFKSGERAIQVTPQAVKKTAIGPNGEMSFETADLDERLYRTVDLQDGEYKDFYREWSPEFRDTNIINGLNYHLRQLEFSVCLSYGDLSDVADVDKTATEAKIAKKRKFNMVAAIQSNLKDCLEDLVYALAFYNAMLRSGYEFSCTFKDSILEDEATERENDRADVALGAMQLWEYRMKHYAEDEETAKKMVAQTADVIE